MREELISLLEDAYESGFITSTVQSQIDAIKKNIKLSEPEYLQIENQIRLDAYIRKVQEREKKGVTFMGDLRKQYKITEDDKLIIQEKLKSASVKTSTSKHAESQKQSKKQAAPSETPPAQKTETKKQSEPSVPVEKEKISDPPKKQEAVKKTETAKKQGAAIPSESDVMKRSELLKEHGQKSEDSTEVKQETVKKQEMPKPQDPTKKEIGSKPLVLVADDNETQLFLTRSILEENNYACVTADTPELAVRIITEKLPALVLCDVNFGIGKPTGFDVFTNIRTKNIKVPFVIMSAFIQKEFKDHAKRIGVTDYITKPAEPKDLVEAIRKYLVR